MRESMKTCAALAAAMLDDELVAIMRRYPGERPTALQKAVKKEAFSRGLETRHCGLPGYDPEPGIGAGPET